VRLGKQLHRDAGRASLRYVMLGKIPSRDTRTVVNALIKLAKKLPDHLYQSLTWIAASSSPTTSLHHGHRHPGLLL
jgi:hypothetical protein